MFQVSMSISKLFEVEMLFLSFFILNGAFLAGSEPEVGVRTPENVTVQVIDSKTVQVFWSTSWKNVERYDVTYNPTENRVVSQAAGNSRSIVLRELRPNTQYQVTVTAVIGGKNYKSRRLVFTTADSPNEEPEVEAPPPTKPAKTRKSYPVTPEVINPDPTAIGSKYTPQTSTTVRGVEIGLVLLALVVWIIAIALFFHRWGKIRMLLPYQPDYKTQQSLKVPGTGTTIVSGCTGSTNTQGQQEGPGCVQHLRWSSRYSDEQSIAKKCSPSRWASRPRISSAIFPASPSFYARASTECESPRMIRHARSQGEFPTEVIPLCQVTQPRSVSPPNCISINVPVIAGNVNERSHSRKTCEIKVTEPKTRESVSSDGDKKIKMEKNECSRKTKGDENSFHSLLNRYYPHDSHPSNRGRDEWQEGTKQETTEAKSLFFIEPDERCRSVKTRSQTETATADKPKRYNRSSLKKQKVRLCEDPDEPYQHVPIIEYNTPDLRVQEVENEKNRKPKDLKTAEMKRKAFLRKISLQDTYLNYNQDYWLDFKKSERFHKSIDLGCFGKEEDSETEADDNRETMIFLETDQKSTELSRQSELFSGQADSMSRWDSDPVISSHCSCTKYESNENLAEIIAKCKWKNGGRQKANWFFLPSNENIPLFSERNGLIETDFDVLSDVPDDECLLPETSDGCCHVKAVTTEPEADSAFPFDFSNFYEIKLTNGGSSNDLDADAVKRSNVFNFQGGQAFFGERLSSASTESDAFFNETETDRNRQFSVRSSSSPPKSRSH